MIKDNLNNNLNYRRTDVYKNLYPTKKASFDSFVARESLNLNTINFCFNTNPRLPVSDEDSFSNYSALSLDTLGARGSLNLHTTNHDLNTKSCLAISDGDSFSNYSALSLDTLGTRESLNLHTTNHDLNTKSCLSISDGDSFSNYSTLSLDTLGARESLNLNTTKGIQEVILAELEGLINESCNISDKNIDVKSIVKSYTSSDNCNQAFNIFVVNIFNTGNITANNINLIDNTN